MFLNIIINLVILTTSYTQSQIAQIVIESVIIYPYPKCFKDKVLLITDSIRIYLKNFKSDEKNNKLKNLYIKYFFHLKMKQMNY